MLDPKTIVGVGAKHDHVSVGIPDARAASDAANEAESRIQTIAAVMELLSALDSAENLDQASSQAARMLCELLSAQRVLILWRRRSGSQLSVMSDSDEESGADAAGQHRIAIAAGEEIAARDSVAQWPPADAGDRAALMAVAQMARHLSAESLTGACLSDTSGHNRGVMLVVEPANASSTNLLHAIEMPLASKLIGIARLQPTPLEGVIRGLVESVRRSRRELLLPAAVALGLVMVLPSRYRIGAVVELQPVRQRFIAVPIEGALQSAHVRPGDIVEEGDLLARINPRELEFELASVRAELNRAMQEKKGLMAQHDVAGSKIAGLETDRLRIRSDLLQYQRDNLEIRSPIDGMVVSGDLKQSEGMPMSRGEMLFEIAPLGQMVVEIAVPESDIAHVRQGLHVDFFVHALPNRGMSGTISRVHPRSELRDNDNVYIAEVRILDPENVLRPGMRGRAKISSDRHPLAWNLFHKSYFALRLALGW
jgi:multidrug efflux pump subunit AcrA (membrane-fusion protein)